MTCEIPQIPNGYIDEDKSTYVYKSSVTIQCNTGYKRVGPEYLICEENGWNLSATQCRLSKIDQCLICLLSQMGNSKGSLFSDSHDAKPPEPDSNNIIAATIIIIIIKNFNCVVPFMDLKSSSVYNVN